MSDAAFTPLRSEDDWSEALEHSSETPVLIFKHSSACPVSGRAHESMEQLGQDDPVPIYKVVVQEHRSVSDEIAEELDVRHETPQAILLHQQEPVFDTSHFDVTADTIREALQRVSSSS